ncbi:MAG: efflux RND transporter permease subunit [Nitrospirota bacterium]
MGFTDIFIKRPVLAAVVSLMILLLGLRAWTELNVRQYPEMKNAVVTVATTFIGADSELIQGFITSPLEREISSAQGIDYIQSTSLPGVSSIQIFLRLDYDPNEALTQIAAKVNKVRRELPEGSEDPVIELSVGETIAAMYLSFYSTILDNNQITDYLVRVIEPRLSTLPGVQRALIIGDRTFAMRIWLKPERLAALNLTASDIQTALQANNVQAAVGATKGAMVSVDLKANTDLQTAEQFRNLVIRSEGDAIVRLGDVADVVLGAETYNTAVSFNGLSATFIGVEVAPDANALDVVERVRHEWPDILRQLPQGLEANIPYDSTRYIRNAINEVVFTLGEAVLIVIVVIFLFLGSLRSVIIPAVTVPLSIIGALFLMWVMGFSINLLTLLAMVLAIGMVVDDAIIVLENIHRHIEDGMKPFDAAIKGARELGLPVIAMTVTLVAVYLPIGFIGGLTGALFVEFAFALAGAVLLSGVIALTLSPMMCARLLRPRNKGGGHRLELWLDRQFDRLRRGYQQRLHGALDDKHVIAVFGVIVLASTYFLYQTSPRELAPEEDQGIVLIFSQSDPYSSLDYLTQFTNELTTIANAIPEKENYFLMNGVGGSGSAVGTNTAISGIVFKPWDERDRTTKDVLQEVQQKAGEVAGLMNAVFAPPPLPTGGMGFPVEFVIASTQPVQALHDASNEILQRGMASKQFIFMDTDLKIDKPQIHIDIDRDKAALLGIDMRQLGSELAAMMSGGYVNRFSMESRSYKVIPQVQRTDRLNPDQLTQYYTRTRSGDLVPLSTLVTLRESVEPQQLKRFQQLNAVVISGVPRPGVTLGDALSVLEQAAAEVLPPGYAVDYAGQSRQYKTEGAALVLTFFFALIIIYLVLAAQFESFRDPIIMLVTVPMSICGALIFVSLGLTTVNIYTQVGLVTLIGVISKHGILIVEFANRLQEQGRAKREAIEEAASIRLRPVLMTTAALVLAVVPLLTATGPGAAARFAIGLVIATGMTIGTAFTLFVVPAVYLYLGRDYAAQRAGETASVMPTSGRATA